MKVTSSAVAASILSSANLCSARNIIESVLLDLVPSSLGSTFRVPQVHNENFVQHGRGPRAVAKTYQKYGVEIPDNLVTVLQNLVFTDMGGAGFSTESDPSGDPSGENSKANVGVGEVSAIPEQYDSEYLAAVQIGTPPQTLCLDFDTASSDLWVFSSATPLSENHGQKIYNSTASSTAKELPNTSWFVSYGDASSSSGNVYTDVVSVAGVTVAEQAVETAYRVSGSFTNDTASSGVMGLAFSILNQVKPVKQKTFFENAMPSLAMPLFTVNLKKGKPGNYNFGFIDQSEFEGPLSFVDVNTTSGLWQFETSGVSVGDMPVANVSHQAIADTGTSLIMLPLALVKAYYAQAPSAQFSNVYGGYYVFNCSTTLPDITFNIGDHQAIVPGSVINFAPADTDSFATAKLCFGGIQSNRGLSYAIYGDIFLKSQFTVFNGGSKQIGFASKPVA